MRGKKRNRSKSRGKGRINKPCTKKKFKQFTEVKKFISRIQRTNKKKGVHVKLRPYFCPYCNNFHLTSKPLNKRITKRILGGITEKEYFYFSVDMEEYLNRVEFESILHNCKEVNIAYPSEVITRKKSHVKKLILKPEWKTFRVYFSVHSDLRDTYIYITATSIQEDYQIKNLIEIQNRFTYELIRNSQVLFTGSKKECYLTKGSIKLKHNLKVIKCTNKK